MVRINRRSVFGILIAFVSSLCSISLISFVAWQSFIQKEQERIDSLAELLVTRADYTFSQVTDALKSLSRLQDTPCSQEHIVNMQKIMFQIAPIDKTVYLKNGDIVCSSLGIMYQLEPHFIRTQADFVTPDSVEVTIKTFPSFNEDVPAMFLKYDSYGIFINAKRFVDIVVEKDISLIIASFDKTIIAMNEQPKDDFIHQLIQGRSDAKNSQNISSVERSGIWIAVATKPQKSMLQYLIYERKTIFPIILIIGLFIFILMSRLILRHPSIQWELRQALKNKEFYVYYQPIIDSRTKRCSGAEALMRWKRPNGSMVRPDIFIPLAEESGFIQPITDQLIKTVVLEMREILVSNPEFHISINISTEDIKTKRVLSVITNALIKTGIKSEQIWFEVTERGTLDVDSACVFLTEARKQGYIIAIDDFGTGCSNLKYLHDFTIDVLKIDKIFVSSIRTGSASSHVVSHIIDMAKSLKIILVAEGVETQSQADYLTACGVEFLQGWLYYKALPAKELFNIVNRF